MEYAGFWRRFGAMWIDVLVLTPLILLVLYGFSKYRLFEIYWLIPSILIGLWFHVYLVVRYGGTPGKLLLKIRILMVDGSSVTYKGAFLRFIVEALLSLIPGIGLALASLQISDSEYYSLEFLERMQRLKSMAPSWYPTMETANQVWIWSEFLTMFFNDKRRAIHDFMGGTVVIKNPN